MSVIVSIIMGVWLLEAAVDVGIAIIQILFGLVAALIGASVLMLILLMKGFAILCRAAWVG